MELKKYQTETIQDLNSYLDYILETGSPSKAYNKLWESKGVRVGIDGLQSYKELIPGVPSVCMKVPTGGGKTLLGCASLKPIFDRMQVDKKKVIVWLVPWDTILTQTYNNLANPSHFYRQQLNRDFSGKVEIFNKTQLLNGQNFNVSSVNEQLSICVMSFDTFRSRSKENRKVYEANANLEQMKIHYEDAENLVSGVDDSALINVLNQLNPIIIIDESHNAKSDLSIEMIKNLNPSFILELTATPKKNSNLISIVTANKLKNENMVKLPVIAYNRPSISRVIAEAIDLRVALENKAKTLDEYIRPIVLFQAQPKTDTDNVTFEVLKQKLVDAGIPENQIAIKTANKNEIANVDLLSPHCPIRYIITINALKEGWDCPFAYILASLANKTSKVDVEQILGRILRQPHQTKFKDPLLNMSYVLASSNDFNDTLQSIIEGLNNAGFTKQDCRAAEDIPVTTTVTPQQDEATDLFSFIPEDDDDTSPTIFFNLEDVKHDIQNSIKQQTLITPSQEEETTTEENGNYITADLINAAIETSVEYEKEIENTIKEGTQVIAPELSDYMNSYKINPEFKEYINNLKLPQFCIKHSGGLFGDEQIELLEKENLTEGFKLSNISLPADLTVVSDNIFKVDVVSTGGNDTVKKFAVSERDSQLFKEMLNTIPEEGRLNQCKSKLIMDLGKIDAISHKELVAYIDRIVSSLDEDGLAYIQNNIMSVEYKIKQHIIQQLEIYRYENFKEKLEKEEIILCDTYSFASTINPLTTISMYPLSLYSEEENNLTDVETKFLDKLTSLDNILCWHRNIAKTDFNINGFINHYPDFIVFTNSGKIILVETKGEHLSNDDSRLKLELGKIWETQAGKSKYRYYMAFLKNPLNEEGSYTVDKLIDLIKSL